MCVIMNVPDLMWGVACMQLSHTLILKVEWMIHMVQLVVNELRKAKQILFFRRIQDTDRETFWKLFQILAKKESSISALFVPGTTHTKLKRFDYFQPMSPRLHFEKLWQLKDVWELEGGKDREGTIKGC